jgi:hypothetical protein
MATPRSKAGFLSHEDGRVEHARFYYGDHEQDPPNRARLDPKKHATWIEDDGAIGIRRGTSVSVGASPAYSTNYDAVDWGN